jgi:putative two-component system response regulator
MDRGHTLKMIEFEQKILDANILIVDDQIINIKLLEKILSQAGFSNLYSTSDSREVVDLYVKNNIDLLLLDIRMPHLDGFEVMSLLQDIPEENDYLPILVLTAELTSETRTKSLSRGAKDFLTKPFDRLEVLQRINNIIEVRLLHKQVINQNKELEQRVRERTKELEDSRLDIVRRLGLAAEYKDNDTGNHIIRMSLFCQLLAKAYGFDQDRAEMLLHAAPMHDVGKIGIPDKILLKPGRLDPDEWKIMQTHVDIGVEILSGNDSALMTMARMVAQTHHERWDGNGYPNRLVGDQIPIEGRICALCDAFDALTSKRPYKREWSVTEALSYLDEQSGHHFDPELVTLFHGILDQVLLLKDKYSDD